MSATKNYTSADSMENAYFGCVEQAYIIASLKYITIPELLHAIAKAGKRVDIYDFLQPDLIDKTTDALAEFIEAVQRIKK